MALRRKSKKVVYKKRVSRPTHKLTLKEKKQRVAAFLIGVTALAIFAILFFRYIGNNNYKSILGERTDIEHQVPGIESLR